MGSLEQKVLPGARRFKDLGVSSTKDLEVPEPLRLQVRRVEKPELTLLSEPPDGKERLAERSPLPKSHMKDMKILKDMKEIPSQEPVEFPFIVPFVLAPESS